MLSVNDKIVIGNIMRIKPALKALISNIFPIFYIGTATIQEHPKSNLTFEVEPQVCEDVPPSFQAADNLDKKRKFFGSELIRLLCV